MALLTFVTLVPLVLTFDATRNILVRVKMSHVLPNIPRWMNIIWLYVMTPAAILTLLFGSLTAGTSGHFRSAHGVSLHSEQNNPPPHHHHHPASPLGKILETLTKNRSSA